MTKVWGKHERDDQWYFVAEFVNEDDANLFINAAWKEYNGTWEYFIGDNPE